MFGIRSIFLFILFSSNVVWPSSVATNSEDILAGLRQVKAKSIDQTSFEPSTDHKVWKRWYDYIALREHKTGTVYSHEAIGIEWQLNITSAYFNRDLSYFPTFDDIECALQILFNSNDYRRMLAFCIRLYNDDRSYVDVRIQRAETPLYKDITEMNCNVGYKRRFPERCNTFNGGHFLSLREYFSNDDQTKSSATQN